MENIYKEAIREKLRFQTDRGMLNSEQLYDLKSTELKQLVKREFDNLSKLEKPGEELSFLEDTISTTSEERELRLLRLRCEILKDVFITRKDEAKNAVEDAKTKKEIEHLEEILAEKKEASLKEKTPEELEEMIKKLRDKK